MLLSYTLHCILHNIIIAVQGNEGRLLNMEKPNIMKGRESYLRERAPGWTGGSEKRMEEVRNT